MSAIGERLQAHWLAQAVTPPAGVTEDRLREFEKRFDVTLPSDMREYFLHVDGMGEPFQWDDDLFNFRPLSQVESIRDLEIALEDRSWYFVFADHSIWLPAYAIRLAPSRTDSHPVIAIEFDPCQKEYEASVVALSFSEFVERYLSDWDSRNRLSLSMPMAT
jgi:cell wall assembly regulator SMI1